MRNFNAQMKLCCILMLSFTYYICNEQNTNVVNRNKDTLMVNMKAAVIYQPDSIQIEKRKKQVGEQDFYAGADDYLFYLNSSVSFLDSMKIKTFYAKGKKFVKFSMMNGKSEVIKLDTLPELWGVYLFEPNKRPKQIDMTTIDEEYKNYYH